MDDNAKQASSYQLDQDILDARGINMTVEEVAGLSTVKYAERVQSLRLHDDDLTFLKGLRRRIKNRLASQNSRRRSMEHLRRLTRELRAVRACRDDALSERRALLTRREHVRERCRRLRQHVTQILQERSDSTEVPSVDIELTPLSQPHEKRIEESISKSVDAKPLLLECCRDQKSENLEFSDKEKIFECRIDKLVQQSVNHIYKERERDKKRVSAKTVFLGNNNQTSCIVHSSDVKSMVIEADFNDGLKEVLNEEMGVLNLSVKESRRSHGRKQSAPRRIAYVYDYDDCVLDLKIKKENQ